MGQMTTETRRVVVTGPRVGGGVTREFEAEHGAVCARSLIRAQLRHALVTCGFVALVVGGLPMVFALVPELSAVRLGGVPLPWLVLGLGVHPLWVVVAARHVRRAERAERDFADHVVRS
jgi:hypothetical protein